MILGTNPKRAFLEVIFSFRLYAFHNPKTVSIMVDKATNKTIPLIGAKNANKTLRITEPLDLIAVKIVVMLQT